MAITMMLCIAPAFADSYTLTTKSGSTTYVQGAVVIINGTLTDTTTATPSAGFLVGVQVTDSVGNLAYSTIANTSAAGIYSTSFS